MLVAPIAGEDESDETLSDDTGTGNASLSDTLIEDSSGSGSSVPEFTYCADIKPIFDRSCGRCHGERPEGGQYPDLDVYAERNAGFGSVSTDLDSSLDRINIGDMPPAGEPDPAVTARQLAIIEAWKAQGAPEGLCD